MKLAVTLGLLLLLQCLNAQAAETDTLILDEETSTSPETPLGIPGSDQGLRATLDGELISIPTVVTPQGDVLTQGDILLGTLAEIAPMANSVQPQSVSDLGLQGLFIRGQRLWPKGQVFYSIELKDSARLTAINRAIVAWQKATSVTFSEKKSDTPNYVAFIDADPDVCLSSVGMRGGRQEIKIGENCKAGNIAHELGHTLGLAHEQMRADRATYVFYHPENVRAGYEGQFAPNPKKYADLESYCYDSLMHYGETAFSRDPSHLKTLEARDGSAIGQRKQIAGCDSQVIDAVYEAEYKKRSN